MMRKAIPWCPLVAPTTARLSSLALVAGATAQPVNAFRFCTTDGSQSKKRLYTPPGGKPKQPEMPDLSKFSQADLDILSKDPTKMPKEELDDFLKQVAGSGALSMGDTMPSMFQYNEHLVQATLNLLNRGSEFTLSEAEESSLCALTEWLMPSGDSEGALSLTEQYQLISSVLMHPQLRGDEVILEACKIILQAMAPPSVHNFFSLVNLEDLAKEGGDAAQIAFHDFIGVVLKGVSDENDEGFIECLKRFEKDAAWLFKSDRFLEALGGMKEAMVQCRLYELVMMACREFDPAGTGRVNLEELQSSLAGILGDEGATQMLKGCEPNSDGTVFYPQMAKVLMDGSGLTSTDPVEITKKDE